MTSSADRCPKCGGTLVCSYGVRSCINCGETPMTNQERHIWWQLNKHAIAKDVREIGAHKTIIKWRIPRQLIGQIYKQKLLQPAGVAPAADPPRARPELPRLPDFQDSWPESVQLRWFDIWLYFASR